MPPTHQLAPFAAPSNAPPASESAPNVSLLAGTRFCLKESDCYGYPSSSFASSSSFSNVEALGKELLELTKGEANNGEHTNELVDAGAKLDILDKNWNTALMWAAEKGRASIVAKLIDAGAEVNHQNKHGVMALICAAGNGHKVTAVTLIDAGADINLRDKYGVTALMYAACYGHDSIVGKLIDAEAELNHKDAYGRTARNLAMVSQQNQWELVVRLLDAAVTPVEEAGNISVRGLQEISPASAQLEGSDGGGQKRTRAQSLEASSSSPLGNGVSKQRRSSNSATNFSLSPSPPLESFAVARSDNGGDAFFSSASFSGSATLSSSSPPLLLVPVPPGDRARGRGWSESRWGRGRGIAPNGLGRGGHGGGSDGGGVGPALEADTADATIAAEGSLATSFGTGSGVRNKSTGGVSSGRTGKRRVCQCAYGREQQHSKCSTNKKAARVEKQHCSTEQPSQTDLGETSTPASSLSSSSFKDVNEVEENGGGEEQEDEEKKEKQVFIVKTRGSGLAGSVFEGTHSLKQPGQAIEVLWDDGLWYTARVDKSVHAGLRVEFVDDGTTTVLRENEMEARVRLKREEVAPQRYGARRVGGGRRLIINRRK
mmetsp:Transcript_785/g.1651  ORF Transcript_785/g.1651 Transcript_785/m.1651 type:complete len:601 (+) Transcript_785:842-2644(+)